MARRPSLRDLMEQAHGDLRALEYPALMRAGLARDPRDYYLLATYPPLRAMAPVTAGEVYRRLEGPSRLYIHIPFCEQYCTFCHYTKEMNPKRNRVDRYLAALKAEFSLCAERRSGALDIRHIFFGGGTPSYLNAEQIDDVMTSLKSAFGIVRTPEIAFELHPSVVRQPDCLDRLRALRDHGVSLWVFGVQSMDEAVLRKLNRGHGRDEVFRLIETLHTHVGADLSLDLIFGLPYQTPENWYDSIVSLIDAGVQKFNIFPLMFKPTDPIHRHYQKDPSVFPDGQERLLMLLAAEALLKAEGFSKGPIGYYSKGRHAYEPLDAPAATEDDIEGVELVPLGVSAFGWVNGTQFFNDCDMERYLASIEAGRLPVWYGQRLSDEERMRRAIMVKLRSRGIDRHGFALRFGVDPVARFPAEFDLLRRHGLLIETPARVRLSPRGQVDASSAACLFASEAVLRATRQDDAAQQAQSDLFEAHSFSPIGHRGVSAQGTPPAS